MSRNDTDFAVVKDLIKAHKILQINLGYIYLDSAPCIELPLDRH